MTDYFRTPPQTETEQIVAAAVLQGEAHEALRLYNLRRDKTDGCTLQVAGRMPHVFSPTEGSRLDVVILGLLAKRPMVLHELVDMTGESKSRCSNAIGRLRERRKINAELVPGNIKNGVAYRYSLSEPPATPEVEISALAQRPEPIAAVAPNYGGIVQTFVALGGRTNRVTLANGARAFAKESAE